jgi:DNA polymerase-3 subunit alpha
MGLIILGPDINKSKDIYTIERQYNAEGKYRDIIRTPLTVLKGVAGKATEEIISLQPFEDLKQFISKIDGRKVNKKVFEALAESGCLSACWKSSPEQLMSDFEILKAEVDKEKKSQKKYDDYVESLGGESIFDIDIGDGFSM